MTAVLPVPSPGGTPAAPGAVVAATGRRWPRLAAHGAAYGAAGLALLLPTSTAGASWVFAGQVLNVRRGPLYTVKVRDVTAGRVALARTPDLAQPVPLGFGWPGGHARLGDIVSATRTTVVRELDRIDRGSLRPGIRGHVDGYLFDGDPYTARGLPFTDVAVPGELGDAPAWLVPPTAPARGTWVIAIHGRAGCRNEVLRVLPTFAAHGLSTLAICYRNDEGAPSSRDGQYHLGDTEWHDVAAVVRYALANGAHDVVLYGMSMGGAMTLHLLRRATAEVVDAVRAVILDCPVIDWAATLRMHARALNAPPAWAWTTMRLIERRLGTPLASLDHRRYADALRVPVLAFVDHDDATVARQPTIEYARLRPDLVTLVETRGGGHCRSWNADPAGYEHQVAAFLDRVTVDAGA